GPQGSAPKTLIRDNLRFALIARRFARGCSFSLSGRDLLKETPNNASASIWRALETAAVNPAYLPRGVETFQRCPSGVSMTATPIAASSSLSLSDSLKFLAARAA